MTDIERYKQLCIDFIKIDQKIQEIMTITITVVVTHVGDINAISEYVHNVIDEGIAKVDEIKAIAELSQEVYTLITNTKMIKESNGKDLILYFDSVKYGFNEQRKMFDEAAVIGSNKPASVIDYNFTQHLIQTLKEL